MRGTEKHKRRGEDGGENYTSKRQRGKIRGEE